MDLKALLAKAGVPSKVVEINGKFTPANDAQFDGRLDREGSPQIEDDLTSRMIPDMDILNSPIGEFDIFKPLDPGNDPGPVPDDLVVGVEVKPVMFKVPASPIVPIDGIRPAPDPDIIAACGENGCAHLCEACNKWWTHGDKSKCRFPDLLKQGLCMDCLNGGKNGDVMAEVIEDDRGRKTLSPQYQVKVRTKEREICKDMTIEQLSAHIEYIYKTELEARARGMEARKVRADAIEEELKDVDEADREQFRQALLTGKVKKEKKVKVSKKDQLDNLISQLRADKCAMPELVAKWMIQTGKTREKVEAMLND